ncbi:MAG TPA: YkvA family protein [Candidatus Limnocylindrales bacterium]|nr:YkvA family protein [Candidatus Limnocylindrales bacterium]
MTNEEASTEKRGRRGRSPGVRRMIAAAALMPLASRAPLYARMLWSLLADSRTPVGKKAMLGAALGYVALGRDIVPDKVPILGQLDDLVVVALAIELFLEGLEEDLLAEKLEEAGIPRAAYDEDVARVRRFIPGPIRRTVGRIPGAVRTAADAVAQSGLQPRLRSWIERA